MTGLGHSSHWHVVGENLTLLGLLVRRGLLAPVSRTLISGGEPPIATASKTPTSGGGAHSRAQYKQREVGLEESEERVHMDVVDLLSTPNLILIHRELLLCIHSLCETLQGRTGVMNKICFRCLREMSELGLSPRAALLESVCRCINST